MAIARDTDPNTPIYIYALIDPRDNRIRYVGWTHTTLVTRLRKHLEDINTKKNNHRINWLRLLRSMSLTPKIEPIEETIYSKRIEREQYWISYYGRENLVNGTDGGEGAVGATRSEVVKNRISEAVKKIMKSEDVRNNLREKSLQAWNDPDKRSRMTKSLKGRTMPDTWLDRLSKAFSGKNNPMYHKTHTEEAREKIRKAREGKPSNNRGIKREGSSSRFLGTYIKRKGDKVLGWTAIVEKMKEMHHIGTYKVEEHSATAYDLAAIFYYGSDCNLNFLEHREYYIKYLSQWQINDIKDLRIVIKNYITSLQEGG